MAENELTLDECKTKRSSMKGQITKFANYLTRFEPGAPLDSVQLNEIALKLNKYLEMVPKLDQIQTRIEILNSANLDDELIERETNEDSLSHGIAIAQSILAKYKTKKHPEKECYNPVAFTLPQITINEFDGAYYKWLEFRDTYISLIHNNSSLQDVNKFHYLLRYLKGEAARVVSNLEVSADNYQEAWELLCDRYNNKRQLVTNHLNALFNIEPIQKENDKALRFLSDHITKNLRALRTLGEPTDAWDSIIIHLASTKFDPITYSKWEEYRNGQDLPPDLDDLKKFIKARADVLETLYHAKREKEPKTQSRQGDSNKQKTDSKTRSFVVSENSNSQRTCVVCQGSHRVFDCNVYKALSTDEKLAQVKKLKLCQNCLRNDHETRRCRLGGCRVCKKHHNTTLHKYTADTTPSGGSNPNPVNNNSDREVENPVVLSSVSIPQVLLCTALVDVVNPKTNKVETVRALLDNGSQSSFITDSLKARLSLICEPAEATSVVVIGEQSLSIVPQQCSALIKSRDSSFSLPLSLLVLPTITGKLPRQMINIEQLIIPPNIKLADPTFNKPQQIEILLGADVFWDLLGPQRRRLEPNGPLLQNSKLGWLIVGPIPIYNHLKQVHCNFASSSIESSLTKFWEYEDFPQPNYGKPEICESERHFIENTTRSEDGRFCVRLPLLESPECLGESYFLAKKRFLALEKRLNQKPELKQMYSDFINEYRELGHLSEAPVQRPQVSYFLPHHAVLKETSESTKLRVVFEANARTSSGFSINDLQMVGPNIQDSLFNILLRFRHYQYVLSGDIEKQYRQVVMSELDRDLQIILWRESINQPIKSLRLNTVTYGFASASFLAARCLWQVGEETADPAIKSIIQNQFYCDDLLCGADSETDLLHIKQAVAKALLSGCFNLRKYRSNSLAVLNSETHEAGNKNLALSESHQTLGLGWNPGQDTLHFDISDTNKQMKTITKRSILSTTFKIFDPLGLLTLCTVKPKILLQKLWALKLDWDDPVPIEIERYWLNFADNVKLLKMLALPRNVLCPSPAHLELHIFSDASQAAYGACVYVKTIPTSGDQVSVSLLCAKSRVAPTKITTIPRLELCAALLASRLGATVRSALRKPIARCVHWSDSSVVLAWLRTSPSKFKVYVANRVSNIQDLTKDAHWRYVPTKLNPADLASRGIDPQHVQCEKLWWHGPQFLLETEDKWPTLPVQDQPHELPETKVTSLLIANDPVESLIEFDRYSNFKKLQRIMAYALRFINNCRKQKSSGPFSVEELQNSTIVLIKQSQQQSFPTELKALQTNKALSPKSQVVALAPFIDSQGILRVGGRLGKSNLDFPTKHPTLLSAKHTLTHLIFAHEHNRLLHAGPQLMLASTREQFWTVGGRDLARRTARKCVVCSRHYGKTLTNIMGNLPSQRLVPDFPFLSVAVDFAGPFLITDRRGRGCKITKCYLCLFICLRYKCVHLEAVSELSKDAFILCLRRFIARRGLPKEIFCDNGRNFVAAAKEIGDFLHNNKHSLCEFASGLKIQFKFAPAYAPNHNGYCESGIKSAKFFIRRILGNTHLTFEELSSLFAQIEAILNSRPLAPLSSSPNDYAALTPGHFLLGRPLTSFPAPDLLDTTTSRLDRYRLLEQMRQQFWRRWQAEYVTELQQRSKWRTRSKDLKVNDLILLKEDNTPPLAWRMGRVLQLYPGTDGVPRVADIQTARGVVRRALNRMCPLLTDE